MQAEPRGSEKRDGAEDPVARTALLRVDTIVRALDTWSKIALAIIH